MSSSFSEDHPYLIQCQMRETEGTRTPLVAKTKRGGGGGEATSKSEPS